MTPLSLYQADLLHPEFFADSAQEQAIQLLQRLFEQLTQRQQAGKKNVSWWSALFNNKKQHHQDIQGLYFYGGVGRGKTYLVDLFFKSLATERKQRLHFHHFMLQVHQQLSELQGEKNPLQQIAKKLAADIDVICFDEFFVEDITDAMILAGMFEALFAQGVVLVATSNIHPDQLYRNGLQRARFLPAIDLINKHCQVFNLDGGKDYRLGRLIEAEIFHFPLDDRATEHITQSFEALATGDKKYEQVIEINQRKISTLATSIDTLSIEFVELCDGPRSVHDYIEIAILYRTVILANVPQMFEEQNDVTRRFIAMVDEFYDRNVLLVLSSEVDVVDLYKGKQLEFEFQRCLSRLLEMQSKSYLGTAHHIDV